MTLEVLAVVASVVFLVRLLPQPLRLARHGVAEGVSPLAALNAVVCAAAWLAYGLVEGVLAVWLTSVFALVPGVWAVLLLRRRTTRNDLLLAGAWVAVVLVSAAVGLLAAALGLGVVVTQGPQVLRALRSHDLRGLAPATWWISIIDATTWGAYGIGLGDAALIGYGAVLLTAAVTVLVRIAWVRRRFHVEPSHEVELESPFLPA